LTDSVTGVRDSQYVSASHVRASKRFCRAVRILYITRIHDVMRIHNTMRNDMIRIHDK
jgi:hypothetical protein